MADAAGLDVTVGAALKVVDLGLDIVDRVDRGVMFDVLVSDAVDVDAALEAELEIVDDCDDAVPDGV